MRIKSEKAAAAALVDWINACPIEPKISNLGELSDGVVILKVLLDIDPFYFKSTAASSDGGAGTAPGAHWVLRFHKLKRLHKDLTRYYTETLGHRLPSPPPNLTLIAKDGNVEETIRLVKITLASAVLSDRREEYIQSIQQLSPTSQTELMGVINQMMEVGEPEDLPDPNSENPRSENDDMDQFRMEEEMARLVADNEAVKAKNKALEKRLGSLQSDFEDNQSRLLLLEDQLSSGIVDKGGYANRTDPVMRSQLDQLQSDVQKLEDVIAEKESTIGRLEGTITSLNRRVDDLYPKAEAGIKYKDDLDEANHTIEKLKKSQNVAEKYRKKLEGMGEMERQLKTLEQQNAQMLQDLRTGQENSKQVPGLKRTLDQYKKQIEKTEAEYAELLRAKTILEVERNMLREKFAGAESQKSKDMERIQNLEEKVRELETGVISKAVKEVNGDLNSELAYSTKTKTDLKLQISKLESELSQIQEGDSAGADNIMLQHMLDDATKAREKLEQDFRQAHTDKLVLEAQLAAVGSGSSIEGTGIVVKLHQQLLDAEEQLQECKRKSSEAQADLSAAKKELATAKSDLSLVGKDKLEALAELKTLTSQELIELREELEEARRTIRDLENDVQQKKSLLNTVLLEKDELSKKVSEQKDLMLEKERSNSELKATIAAFEGTTEGRDSALEKRTLQLQNKLEDRREKMTKSREHIKKQNGIIKELKEQLEMAQSSNTDAAVKAKEEQIAEMKKRKQEELVILERENTLISTAWYDQASRLQMNSVVLKRRSDAPSSWLNKQRNAISSSNVC